VAARVCEYGVSVNPEGNGEVVVMVSGPGLTVSENVTGFEISPLLSVTVTENVEIP
jgi:hypothetical protein